MPNLAKTAIFCFRRDLRTFDNIGLNRAVAENEGVIPVFVFDPRQLEPHDYRSERALHFMLLALEALEGELKAHGSRLTILQGLPQKALIDLAGECGANAIYLNRDHTPFSRKRDDLIRAECQRHEISLKECDDLLLNPPEICLKQDGSPYTIFTPFYNNARQFLVMEPEAMPHSSHFMPASGPGPDPDLMATFSSEWNLPELVVKPEDLSSILSALSEQGRYETARNELAHDATTHLSAFLKFGLVSVRDVYHQVASLYGKEHPLIRQLYWRDFYAHIGYHFPRVFKSAFKIQFDAIEWDSDTSRFEAWCQGRTGFPIVDAGMRELNATGFMHNRARMITASFLVKDLHLDWRWGERYFASKLMDYDPALNNGNWQWAASTGCDAQPYFRIFNPWLQQKKFDPQCEYIKRWIPELEDASSAEIHSHYKAPLSGYSNPLVGHADQARKAKQLFQTAAQDHEQQRDNSNIVGRI